MTGRLQELPAYQRLPGTLVHARGARLAWDDGREQLDFYGGHCVNTLGAGDEELFAALSTQWSSLSFATNLVQHPGRDAFLAGRISKKLYGTCRATRRIGFCHPENRRCQPSMLATAASR